MPIYAFIYVLFQYTVNISDYTGCCQICDYEIPQVIFLITFRLCLILVGTKNAGCHVIYYVLSLLLYIYCHMTTSIHRITYAHVLIYLCVISSYCQYVRLYRVYTYIYICSCGPIRHVETCPDFFFFSLQEYTQQNPLSKF
jgi:hypothetical protein